MKKKLQVMGWLSFCLVFGACTSKKKDTSVLHMVNESEIEAIDPHKVTGVPENRVLMACFEGLMRYNPKTGGAMLGTAESYTISPNGKVYTFKIRKSAKWSDGSPVTAQDYVYSFQRALNPKTASQYAFMLHPIKGAKAYNTGKVKDVNTVGLRAKDPITLVVELERVVPYFIETLTHYSFFPVPQKAVKAHGIKWTAPKNIKCNGAFKSVSVVLQDKRVFKKNKHYWDRANVHFKKLVIYAVENNVTRVRKFENHEAHWSVEPPSTEIQRFKGKSSYHVSPYLGAYYFIANVKRGPLKNPKVRQALAMTVNRKQITDHVLMAGQQPAYALLPPGIANYVEGEALISEDIQKAKQLMAEAGYPNGKGFPELNLLYNTHSDHKKLVLAATDMWKRHLGITVKPYNKEWKTYLTEKRLHDFDIARAGWIGDYNDPTTFLGMWTHHSSFNDAQWHNAEYDALLEKSKVELNLKKRAQLLNKAEKILMTEMPIIPIYHYVTKDLVSPKLKGWYPNLMGHHPFVGLKFSK